MGLEQATAGVATAVDSAAIVTIEGSTRVFVPDGAGLRAATIEVGRTDGRRTEVLKGLKAGEQYVVKGAFILKAELGKNSASHEH